VENKGLPNWKHLNRFMRNRLLRILQRFFEDILQTTFFHQNNNPSSNDPLKTTIHKSTLAWLQDEIMHRNRTRLESQGISEGEILDEQLKALRNQATWLLGFFVRTCSG